MADVSSVSEVLQKVLENLNAEDLVKLQNGLVSGTAANFPAIAKSAVLGVTVQATVRAMVQAYGLQDVVEVCEINLKTMNHSHLAQSLSGIKGSLHPVVPYEQVLYEGLKNQTAITVQGQVKHDAEKFNINLYRDSDIAFHFNPRFNEGGTQVIVRNSLIRNVWGSEERELPLFPFTPGKAFELKILCTDSGFRVEADKKLLLDFNHRIKEIDQIRKVSVAGDVLLQHVTINPIPLWMTAASAYVLNDVLSENMTITIPVHVKPRAEKFTIDVMKDKDIFFHLKPYFSDGGKGAVIVRNSRIDGVWGPEERETPSFPFARGKSFLVKILCTEKEFKVYVNDGHLLNFTYRGFDFTKINKVLVHQDVITWNITVESCRRW